LAETAALLGKLIGDPTVLKVRLATEADLPALLDLGRQCPTAGHWSQQQYKELFRTDEGDSRRFVLVLDALAEGSALSLEPASSRTLGFLVARHVPPDWELENIVVAPGFRRKGLATQLLAALLTRAHETNSESVFLEVRESNQAARALYRRHGFEENGRRGLYYANPPEDAVLYRLDLSRPSA
jgi:[ribosomal protein S18]-alanine N-acetyltransferase